MVFILTFLVTMLKRLKLTALNYLQQSPILARVAKSVSLKFNKLFLIMFKG